MPRVERLPSPDRDDFFKDAVKGSPRNVRYQVGCLDEFLRFCLKSLGHYNLHEITRKDINEYVRFLHSKRGARATTLGKITLVIRWFRWLQEEDRLSTNPTKGLVASKLLDEAN